MWNMFFWKDFAERALFTALQALLGIVTVEGFELASLDAGATLTIIGVAVLGVLVKALAAAGVGQTVSPASLAKDRRGI